jgi:NDP-sugar pyrophosphorylase family protein
MNTFRDVTVPVILAGGRGTRIAGIFPFLPKPAIPVAGKPFLIWLLGQLYKAGFSDVVISGGHLFEVLKEKVSTHISEGMNVHLIEEREILGTGGGAMHAIKKSGLQADFWLICNGDSLVCASFTELIGCLHDAQVAILAIWQDDASRYGTLEVGEGSILKAFREKRPGSGWINAGVYLFHDSIFSRFPVQRPLSFETEVFPSLMTQGVKVRVHQVRAPFLDIGTPESLSLAESFVRANQKWFLSERELS